MYILRLLPFPSLAAFAIACLLLPTAAASAQTARLHVDSTATGSSSYRYTLSAITDPKGVILIDASLQGIWPSDPRGGLFAAAVQGDTAVVHVRVSRSARRAVDVIYTDLRSATSTRVGTIRHRPYPALAFAADSARGALWMAQPSETIRREDDGYRTDAAGVYALAVTPEGIEQQPLPVRDSLSAAIIRRVARQASRGSVRASLHVADSLLTYTIRTADTTLVGRYRRRSPLSSEADRFCSSIHTLNVVPFGFGVSSLNRESRLLLKENIAVLQRCPQWSVRLLARSQRSETAPTNRARARAKAVRAWYEAAGLAPARIHEASVSVRYDIANTGRQRIVESVLVPSTRSQ